ncbi:MAG: cellulase family glycosylhydrolase, partial [Kiritimatiellae bacterium]|nr:cellulase family glycosylhydrolase [Kiritimatiellia bacterium]
MGRLDFSGMAAAAVVLIAASASAMFPFVPSYDSPKNVVNMSHLLEAPAGKNGRIRVKDGHFVNDKGRVKFHATNLTGPANFPTHEEAERLAARLARFGINCVRLHYFDSTYLKGNFMLTEQKGIMDHSGATRRKFDPAQRERMDYLVAQFKKRGIYVNINLHVARHLG